MKKANISIKTLGNKTAFIQVDEADQRIIIDTEAGSDGAESDRQTSQIIIWNKGEQYKFDSFVEFAKIIKLGLSKGEEFNEAHQLKGKLDNPPEAPARDRCANYQPNDEICKNCRWAKFSCFKTKL